MKNNIFRCVLAVMLFLFPAVMAAYEITAPTDYFLMHSSGHHLAKSNDGKAIIKAGTISSPKMLTFTPTGDGYYTIALPDGKLLTLEGSYGAKFIDGDVSDKSKFSIVEVGKVFVKIKCKSNGKFLGTDSTKEGSTAFLDKSGDDSRHYWFFSTDPKAEPDTELVKYIINPHAERQLFDGWGVSLCWWANMCGKWSDEKIDEIIDWLVDPQGLNFRFFRYNIGGGDDPENKNCDEHHMGRGKGLRAEMEGFKDSSDGPYIWTRDEAQRKIMLKIKEKRPDAVFEAFSNSCPYYMTYSGCVSGNSPSSKDNLKPEYYEEFAHYLVDVCKHYKDEYGIEFRTLDPFNEPMTNYWGKNGGQEGCHFDVSSQIAFIKVLYPILKESGLSTVISAADETSVAQSVKDFEEYRKAGILDMVGQWNTHTYTVDNSSRAKLSALCREAGMPLWMSEVGQGGTGITGNLNLAQKLINDMRYIMPSAWIDWQYIEENNDQWCLVKADSFEDGLYHKVKNYSVRSHFSRFIKEGYTILTSFDSRTLAAINPERDEMVLVVVNASQLDVDHVADLSMFASAGDGIKAYVTDESSDLADMTAYTVENGKLSFRLNPLSIVTFIIPVTVADNADKGVVAGKKCLITPRNAANLALCADAGGVTVTEIGISKAQVWTLKEQGKGHVITNDNGLTITENANEYMLTAKSEAAEGQEFVIKPVDDLFYRILNSDESKGFDLEGEGSSAGTRVGVWNYGDNSAPIHRQWMIMYLPENIDISGIDNAPVAAADAPVSISAGSEGITVDNISGCAGTLRVYSAAGVCVYSCAMPQDSVTVPLGRGYYIVSVEGASAYARPVLVR